MRYFIRSLVLSGCLCATAARAAIWQIGPSIGVDMMSQYQSSLGVIGTPPGADDSLRPGLRVGAWDSGLRHEFFLDTSVLFVSGASKVCVASNTLNYAYAFGSASAWYVTAGGGLATVRGNLIDGDTSHLYGLGLGHRFRLKHGHGSIRIEGRLDGADGSDFGNHVSITSLRMGFDLDLN